MGSIEGARSMKYFYIEYTLFCDDDYEESGSHVIEAKNKKQAKKKLIENTDDDYNKIEIDTIYETSSDARP